MSNNISIKIDIPETYFFEENSPVLGAGRTDHYVVLVVDDEPKIQIGSYSTGGCGQLDHEIILLHLRQPIPDTTALIDALDNEENAIREIVKKYHNGEDFGNELAELQHLLEDSQTEFPFFLDIKYQYEQGYLEEEGFDIDDLIKPDTTEEQIEALAQKICDSTDGCAYNKDEVIDFLTEKREEKIDEFVELEAENPEKKYVLKKMSPDSISNEELLDKIASYQNKKDVGEIESYSIFSLDGIHLGNVVYFDDWRIALIESCPQNQISKTRAFSADVAVVRFMIDEMRDDKW